MRRVEATGESLLMVLIHKREREVIVEYLARYKGHVGRTATALGIKRRSLEMKMLEHGLRDDASAMRDGARISGKRSHALRRMSAAQAAEVFNGIEWDGAPKFDSPPARALAMLTTLRVRAK